MPVVLAPIPPGKSGRIAKAEPGLAGPSKYLPAAQITRRSRDAAHPAGSKTDAAPPAWRAGSRTVAMAASADQQHELPAHVTVLADAVGLRDLGEREGHRDRT